MFSRPGTHRPFQSYEKFLEGRSGTSSLRRLLRLEKDPSPECSSMVRSGDRICGRVECMGLWYGLRVRPGKLRRMRAVEA